MHVACCVVITFVILLAFVALSIYIGVVIHYSTCASTDKWPVWPTRKAIQSLKSAVKRVYGLTLAKNKAKTTHITNVMKNLGLPFRLWYGYDAHEKGVEGICSPQSKRLDGEIGCTLSHLAIWKNILQTKPAANDWFIIFEDDANPVVEHSTLLSFLAESFQRITKENYRFVSFGCLPIMADIRRAQRLDRHRWVLKGSCLHAYALRGDVVQDLVTLVSGHLCKDAIDIVLTHVWTEPGVVVTPIPFNRWKFYNQLKGMVGLFDQRKDTEEFKKSDIQVS